VGSAGVQANIDRVRRAAAEAGRDPRTITAAALTFAVVNDDRGRAQAIADHYLQDYYGPPDNGLRPGPRPFVGPADECVRAAEEYFNAGVEVLIIGAMTSDPHALDRLCDQVLPRLVSTTTS
jgi:alkanesulfonate monooxygenase SsuD/methylene tetrahydromethanopterin reductase-like flavin-dependent oxidoreductase (luciferase family)